MSSSSLPITVVEAFTIGNKAYTGNPAAVVHLEFDDDIDDVTKQGIANTMNLSETAFISNGWKRSEGASLSVDSAVDTSTVQRTLRWFTPKTEVPLCGHATVASAKAILSEKHHDSPIRKIEFLSLYRGILGASISETDTDDGQLITLDFPGNTTVPIPLDSPWLPDYARIVLGTSETSDPLEFIKDVEYCEKESMLLIRLVVNEGNSPLDFISKFTPDFGALSSSTKDKTGGLDMLIIIVTVQGEGDSLSEGDGQEQEESRPHFYSRVLAPGYGLNEDPVTGMAYTVLTSYWTRELGRDGQSVRARQASKRGGDLVCQLVNMDMGNGNEERVTIGGRARVVLKGQLNV